MGLANPLQGSPDPQGDRDAGPFGGGAGRTIAAAESNGSRQLMGEKVDFGSGPFAFDRITESLGLSQGLAEIGEPVPVGLLGLGIQMGIEAAQRGGGASPRLLPDAVRAGRFQRGG